MFHSGVYAIGFRELSMAIEWLRGRDGHIANKGEEWLSDHE